MILVIGSLLCSPCKCFLWFHIHCWRHLVPYMSFICSWHMLHYVLHLFKCEKLHLFFMVGCSSSFDSIISFCWFPSWSNFLCKLWVTMQNMVSFAFTTFLNKVLQIQTFTTTLSFIYLFLKKITKSKIVKTQNKTISFHIILSIF
jgi:hypothetical protein